MAEVEAKAKREAKASDGPNAPLPIGNAGRPGLRILPLLVTLVTVAIAALLGWAMWKTYMGAPWTRDGTVRAYVVTIAPEVAGRIVELPVADNQFVHRGDLLMVIDPTNYKIAVELAEATAERARIDAQNAQREAKRREELTNLAVTTEEQQTYATNAVAAEARSRQAAASLAQARVDLERTQIRSPVNGWVTHLLARLGDYAIAGQTKISVVDADSFWVDGYFEETVLDAIREGDPATIKLMGHSRLVRGHVDSIARGINVPNAQSDPAGLAVVNPVFTWVRLAQRVPVRIHLDEVPDGVRLIAGMTASVQIDPRPAPTER